MPLLFLWLAHFAWRVSRSSDFPSVHLFQLFLASDSLHTGNLDTLPVAAYHLPDPERSFRGGGRDTQNRIF